MTEPPVPIPIFPKRPEDPRTDKQIASERVVARRQVTRWEEIRTDPTWRRAVIDILTGRRARRADLVQFEAVDNNGSDTLIVSGELLVRDEDLKGLDDDGKQLLDELGLVSAPVRGLPGIRKLFEADPGAARVRGRTFEVAKKLVERGIRVRPSYITPLGMIRKAEGGAEHSEWVQTMPEAGTPFGPKVVVIDTGVTDVPRSDGWLAGLGVPGAVDHLDVIPQPDGLLDLGAGHGSFAAGAVQQVAPSVDLHVRQALDTDGLADETTMAAAIVAAAQNGADILNLSFGTDTLEPDPPLALITGIRQAIAARPAILMVCAAGNLGDTRDVWPASFHKDPEFAQHVVSVAALRRDETTGLLVGAEWSTHGDVTCSTNGEAVVSTYVVGTESLIADPDDPDTFTDPSWATWNGTSFAAPQIVGAVVAAMQEPANAGLTAFEVLDQVVLAGAPTIPGYGRCIEILPS